MNADARLERAVEELMGHLESYGATDRHLAEMQRRLAEQRGNQPLESEVVWELARYGAEHADDLQDAKIVYFHMAMFLNRVGRDAFPALVKAARAELTFYKQEGCKEVEVCVCTGDACTRCCEVNGKRFAIDEALERLPVPRKDCTHELYDEQHGFCRCSYDMVIEDPISEPAVPLSAADEAELDALMNSLAEKQASDLSEVSLEVNLFKGLDTQG